MGHNRNGKRMHYSPVNRSDVPQGRKGKHRKAVSDILGDLTQLDAQQAVSELGEGCHPDQYQSPNQY
jgi:hypothetical protein